MFYGLVMEELLHNADAVADLLGAIADASASHCFPLISSHYTTTCEHLKPTRAVRDHADSKHASGHKKNVEVTDLMHRKRQASMNILSLCFQ